MTFNQMNDLPAPTRFVVSQDIDGFKIRWQWYSIKVIVLLFICFFWFGFLSIWYGATISSFPEDGAAGATFSDWFNLLFPLIHVAVGVFLGYSCLCGFVNHTVITLEPGQMIVRHGPLPWPGNIHISVSDIKQLYVHKKVTHGKNSTTVRYFLKYFDSQGKSRALIKNAELDEVQYLEYILEKKLGIRNEAVAGEYKSI